MRPGLKTFLGTTLVAPGILVATLGWNPSFGDEPSRLSRFFRFGGNSSGSASSSPSASPASSGLPADASFPPDAVITNPGSGAGPKPYLGSASPASSAPGPRLVPQPRVSRSVTESDPIVTRISLARSNEGNQFGMFLQIYADGTIIDSEGTHHVSDADLKPVTDALAASELYRLRGHCGAPATDFVEQVQMIVYERSLGRLRANSFSYSGNPQGCDHSVRHLHAALDALQAKLMRTGVPAAPSSPGPVPSAPVSPAPDLSGPTISLTPIN